jgi:hypothetical protein
MTETLNRPARPSPLPPRRPAPVERDRSALSLGAGAGVWAVAAGLLCVALPLLLFWAADSRSGAGWVEVLRGGGRFWLLAHGVTLDVPGGRFALTPLGLALLPLVLIARFATSAARDAVPSGLRPAAALAVAVAVPYAVLAMLVAVVCSGPDVHVSPVASLLGGFTVAALGAGVGVLRTTRLWRAAWHGLSRRTRRLAAAAVLPLALLLGAGALLVAVSLLVHFPEAVEIARASEPGAAGGAALLLAGLALVPNAAIWAAGWLAGPGFAVGVGTAVGPFGYELGPVPALPLLAALPGGGVPEWVAVLVLGVPVLGGFLAGRRVAVELADEVGSARRVVVESAPVGPVCGGALGLLAWLSGGAAGGERLVQVGPAPWAVLLAVSAAVGAGAVAGALVHRARLLDAAQPR